MARTSAVIFDFSRTILLSKDPSYTEGLNKLHHELVEKYGTYNAWDYFVLNDELLEYIKSLRPRCPVYVFTSDAVQTQPQIHERIAGIFDDIFCANELSIRKKDPAAYVFLAGKIQKSPAELLYIDDNASNLPAAVQAGLKTILYNNNQQLFSELLSFV